MGTFPYRHRIAVADDWIVNVLERALVYYVDHCKGQRAIADMTGEPTMVHTQEVCYALAALEQVRTEKDNQHGCTRHQYPDQF